MHNVVNRYPCLFWGAEHEFQLFQPDQKSYQTFPCPVQTSYQSEFYPDLSSFQSAYQTVLSSYQLTYLTVLCSEWTQRFVTCIVVQPGSPELPQVCQSSHPRRGTPCCPTM
uniref:Uncharacterized protein n=1 Tax=Cacopsylla melanoneura TaxID=428564 RepID=A0A8D8ZV51_9HEMI